MRYDVFIRAVFSISMAIVGDGKATVINSYMNFTALVKSSWQSSFLDECFRNRTDITTKYLFVHTNNIDTDNGFQWILFQFDKPLILKTIQIEARGGFLVRADNMEVLVSDLQDIKTPNDHCKGKFMQRMQKADWLLLGNTQYKLNSLESSLTNKNNILVRFLLIRKKTQQLKSSVAYINFNNISLYGSDTIDYSIEIQPSDTLSIGDSMIFKVTSGSNNAKVTQCGFHSKNSSTALETLTNRRKNEWILSSNGTLTKGLLLKWINLSLYIRCSINFKETTYLIQRRLKFKLPGESSQVNVAMDNNSYPLKEEGLAKVKITAKKIFSNSKILCQIFFENKSNISIIPEPNGSKSEIDEYHRYNQVFIIRIKLEKKHNNSFIKCSLTTGGVEVKDFFKIKNIVFRPQSVFNVSNTDICTDKPKLNINIQTKHALKTTRHSCYVQRTNGQLLQNISLEKKTSGSDGTVIKYAKIETDQSYDGANVTCQITTEDYPSFKETFSECVRVNYPPKNLTIKIQNKTVENIWPEKSYLFFSVTFSRSKPLITSINCTMQCSMDKKHNMSSVKQGASETEYIVSFRGKKSMKKCIRVNCDFHVHQCNQLVYTQNTSINVTVYHKTMNNFITAIGSLQNGSFIYEENKSIKFQVKSIGGFPPPIHQCNISLSSAKVHVNYISNDTDAESRITNFEIKQNGSSRELDGMLLTCVTRQGNYENFTETIRKPISIIYMPAVSVTSNIQTEAFLLEGNNITAYISVANLHRRLNVRYSCSIITTDEDGRGSNMTEMRIDKESRQEATLYKVATRNMQHGKVICTMSYMLNESTKYSQTENVHVNNSITIYYKADNTFSLNAIFNNSKMSYWTENSSIAITVHSKLGYPIPKHTCNCEFLRRGLAEKQEINTYNSSKVSNQGNLSVFLIPNINRTLDGARINCEITQGSHTAFKQTYSKNITVLYPPATKAEVMIASDVWMENPSLKVAVEWSKTNTKVRHNCNLTCPGDTFPMDVIETNKQQKSANGNIQFEISGKRGWENCSVKCQELCYAIYEDDKNNLQNRTILIQSIQVINSDHWNVNYPSETRMQIGGYLSKFNSSRNKNIIVYGFIENSTASIELTSTKGYPKVRHHLCQLDGQKLQVTQTTKSESLTSEWTGRLDRSSFRSRGQLNCSVWQGSKTTRFIDVFTENLEVYYNASIVSMKNISTTRNRTVLFTVNTTIGYPHPQVTCKFWGNDSSLQLPIMMTNKATESHSDMSVFHFYKDFNDKDARSFMSVTVQCSLNQTTKIWENFEKTQEHLISFRVKGRADRSEFKAMPVALCVLGVGLTAAVVIVISIKLVSSRRTLEEGEGQQQLELRKTATSDVRNVKQPKAEEEDNISRDSGTEDHDRGMWGLTHSEWLKMRAKMAADTDYMELGALPDWSGVELPEEHVYHNVIGILVDGKVQLFTEDVYDT